MSKKRNLDFEDQELQGEELIIPEAFNETGEVETEEVESPQQEGSENKEVLDPASAGCRAFGDTVLEFPALPEKPFVDYRAEVVQNCFRNQPSVMELEVEVE